MKACRILILSVFSVFLYNHTSLAINVPQLNQESKNKVGILLLGFGEPGKYDEYSVEAWRNFLHNYMKSGMTMLEMPFMYPMVKDVMIPMMDTGTLLVDPDNPLETSPNGNTRLMDAWTGMHPKEGTYISIPQGDFPMLGPLFPYYVVPGGPGKGVPDFWEYVGLEMYGLYKIMGGYNPGGEREERIFDEVETRLKGKYGDRVVIKKGYGAARPGFPPGLEAAEEMLKLNPSGMVLAMNYVCFSEFENPAAEIQEELGENVRFPVVVSGQVGGTASFNQGIAKKVQEELERIPADAPVVVLLSHHGMFDQDMVLYDWAKEPYHEHAKVAFEGAKEAVLGLDAVKGRKAKVDVWQVYAEFAEGSILRIDTAADRAKKEGFSHIINIPYEVGNSGFETLIGLRGAWGREPGNWQEYYEDGLKKYREEFLYNGMNVVIADGWIDGHAQGYLEQITHAVDSVIF